MALSAMLAPAANTALLAGAVIDTAGGALTFTVAAAWPLFAETLIWRECRAGEDLADFGGEDGASQRYAVINLGGADRADLARRCRAVQDRLGFRLKPL